MCIHGVVGFVLPAAFLTSLTNSYRMRRCVFLNSEWIFGLIWYSDLHRFWGVSRKFNSICKTVTFGCFRGCVTTLMDACWIVLFVLFFWSVLQFLTIIWIYMSIIWCSVVNYFYIPLFFIISCIVHLSRRSHSSRYDIFVFNYNNWPVSLWWLLVAFGVIETTYICVKWLLSEHTGKKGNFKRT